MKKMNSRFFATLLAAVVLFSAVLSGCGTSAQNPASGTQAATSEVTAQTPAETSAVQETVDPLGKYSPEIDVKTFNYTNSTVKYREGESSDNNVWTRAYKDALGINVKYAWIVDESQFFQKINITIASGDLPDIFPVNGQQMNTLISSDSIEDLAGVYEKYVSPQATGIIDQDPNVFNLGKREGKLYGLANTTGASAYDGPAMLYVRADWLKKLSLPEPRTMEDFFKIAEAFVNQDPDGNNKKDTYAMALTKTLARGDSGTAIQGFAGLQGFANAYHAYLGTWIRDASGSIVYGSIQPEVKAMLQKLQEMYKSGWLDKEFPVKDSAKASEATTGGKVGLEFGQMWNPFYPLNFTVENDKNADWQPYPIPSIDDKPAKVSTSVTAYDYWVVRKGYEHPEAAIKMMNLFTEKCWGETADNDMFNGDGSNYVPFKYALVQAWPSKKNIDAHNHVAEAIKNNDPSKLNVEEKNYYDQAQAYLTSGDPKTGWGANKIFGQNATFDVINTYLANDSYLYDEYHNIPTPTMVDKMSTLDKLENEVFTKIILGQSIDSFDKFVSDWKKLGGDDITKELNEASK
jgi:putative aldouronate transport system substrate-binding protein